MGCAKCKQKKEKQNQNKVDFKEVKNTTSISDEIRSNDSDNTNGNAMEALKSFKPDGFFIRVITFLALVVAIPLLSIYLVVFLFYNFFIPNKNDMTISFSKAISVIVYPLDKWRQYKRKVKRKSREREFSKNRDYKEGSDLLKGDVINTTDEDETLEDVELLIKDNDKDEK